MPTGWTSYLHWQAMLDALRGRKAAESAASPLAHEAASHSDARAALPRPEPRAALPDRRRRSPSEIGALDDWLERTQD